MMKKSFVLCFVLLLSAVALYAQFEELSTAEASKLETKLKKEPTDEKSRKELIMYYAGKKSGVAGAALQKHRLALIKFNPVDATRLYTGYWSIEDAKKPDYIALKNEWLKKITDVPTDSLTRFNAVDFFEDVEPNLSEKLLADGETIEPENPEFTQRLVKFYVTRAESLENDFDAPKDESKIRDYLKKVTVAANRGLEKLKNHGANDLADSFSSSFFQAETAKAFYKLEDYANAKVAAFDLLKTLGAPEELDYETDVSNFQLAMSILGRIELQSGNVAKAREYLLNSLDKLNRNLAFAPLMDAVFLEEILVAEGKRGFIEYLRLMNTFINLNDDQKSLIGVWQKDLANNKVPDFTSYFDKLY